MLYTEKGGVHRRKARDLEEEKRRKDGRKAGRKGGAEDGD